MQNEIWVPFSVLCRSPGLSRGPRGIAAPGSARGVGSLQTGRDAVGNRTGDRRRYSTRVAVGCLREREGAEGLSVPRAAWLCRSSSAVGAVFPASSQTRCSCAMACFSARRSSGHCISAENPARAPLQPCQAPSARGGWAGAAPAASLLPCIPGGSCQCRGAEPRREACAGEQRDPQLKRCWGRGSRRLFNFPGLR